MPTDPNLLYDWTCFPSRHTPLEPLKMKPPSLFVIVTLVSFSLLFHWAESTTSPPFACDSSNPSTKSYPFCWASLPIRRRVQDLISRLTLEEKIAQLVNTAPAIPRLGIPAYQWWSEALHGVAYVGNSTYGIKFNGAIRAATSFPQVILTAASFDSLLWYRIGEAIGREARALYNAGQATGLSFWAPNVNIFRDPRWGRGQETPGEDPLLTGTYAKLFVRGLQGDSFQGGNLGGDRLQASACCKHFTAYDLDNWKGVNRFVFDAHVTLQDLADTFQPPFHSCIQEGRASGIMCGYNRVNGVPNCADYNLLSKTARKQWGFQGYIVSDCDAVEIIYDEQGYTKTPEEAVADVLKAGMDVDCGYYTLNYTESAVKQKILPESEIDRAIRNLFSVRMRLGLFNGNPLKQPYGNIRPSVVCSQEHRDLALEVALDGIVLLKNSNGNLPLKVANTRSLAVVGHNANNVTTLLGNYEGPPCKIATPLQGLQSYVKHTRYLRGCETAECSSASIDQAVNLAQSVDQVVLVMGLDQTQEREGFDRSELVLPGKQQRLITEVARAAKKPVVLVLICGGPIDISFAKQDHNIGSILWAGYPSEAGGTALAQIIFGDHNPGGRLPMTWYPQKFTKVAMTDMRVRPDPSSGYPGRTYRFYRGEKVFEFGYGLSYTNYTYEFISVSKNTLDLRKYPPDNHKAWKPINLGRILVSELGEELCKKNKFKVTIGVENYGEMAGKSCVLLFVRQDKPGNVRAIKQLIAFQSAKLNAWGKADVVFELNPCEQLSRADEDGSMVIDNGIHFLNVENKEFPVTVLV